MSSRRQVQLLDPIENDHHWFLRNYLIRAAADEDIDVQAYIIRLHDLVDKLEHHQLSPEFEYLRIGFVLGHFGRRGVFVSLWHWGKWVTTLELFNQRWYAYGRDLDALLPLDAKEPMFSEFDVSILKKEFALFDQITSAGFDAAALEKFRCFDPRL